jgi:hypothetical protein
MERCPNKYLLALKVPGLAERRPSVGVTDLVYVHEPNGVAQGGRPKREFEVPFLGCLEVNWSFHTSRNPTRVKATVQESAMYQLT